MTPEGILALFDQRWRLAESLRALARVTVTSPQGRYSTRQTFLWRRPAPLRLDTLSLFGQPVMSLVADATQISIYYAGEGTFFPRTQQLLHASSVCRWTWRRSRHC
jgi:hypothetical protein